MNVTLAGLNPPLRITPLEPMDRDQFWRFGAENPNLRLERWANGDIEIMTPTKRNTGSRNARITRMLGNWAEEDGRGECFDSSTGFELRDGSVLSPDWWWVAFDRLRNAEQEGRELPLCPEFVIELRSESDNLSALQKKMRTWMANGTELAWLIDPRRKVVEIYRAGQAEPQFEEGQSGVYGEAPVGGFVLELGRIWG